MLQDSIHFDWHWYALLSHICSLSGRPIWMVMIVSYVGGETAFALPLKVMNVVDYGRTVWWDWYEFRYQQYMLSNSSFSAEFISRAPPWRQNRDSTYRGYIVIETLHYHQPKIVQVSAEVSQPLGSNSETSMTIIEFRLNSCQRSNRLCNL